MNEGLYVLLAFVGAWFFAQLIKLILVLVKVGPREVGVKMVLQLATKSGGMPSGHSASMAAATMFLGLAEGFNSIYFALSFCLLCLFAYDAVNVRWAVGEQGKMLKELMRRKIRIVEGHTVPQMIVGILLGVAVGTVVFVFYKVLNGGF